MSTVEAQIVRCHDNGMEFILHSEQFIEDIMPSRYRMLVAKARRHARASSSTGSVELRFNGEVGWDSTADVVMMSACWMPGVEAEA